MATYVLTGVTRGIGREVVRLLADGDDELVLVGRDPTALAALADTLPRATWVVVDLAEPDDVPAAGWPDAVDGLVHCGGVAGRFRVADTDPATYLQMFTVNVVAVAELTRVLLPALRAAGGTVVLVNSNQGLTVGPASTAYAASKHALRAYADGLRGDEPEVRVVSVFPGRVATDMQRELRAQEHGAYEPEHYIDPVTAAGVIVDALRLPKDAVVTDLRLMPRNP